MNINEIINKIAWWIPFKGLRNTIREYLLLKNKNNISLNKKIDDLTRKVYELERNNARYNDIISDILLYKDIKQKIFFIGTPEHANIGDHAIAYATNKILKKIFPNKVILEYTNNDFFCFKNILYKFIKDDDIIIFHGGGNLGNLWIIHELFIRRNVINRFKNNKIIIFPQSIYFTDDDNGRNELSKSKKIYNSHNNLTIMTRDIVSYELAKEYFYNNNIILSPDIVLSLFNHINIDKVDRNGVLFLLRDDKEKIIDDIFINNIKNYLDFINVSYSLETNMLKNTIDDCKVERENIVINQLNNVSKYKLCITDRLHGAIFSYITNTPCIVLNSLYHKIEYGLKWLDGVDSITYIAEKNDIEYIKPIINKYLNTSFNNNLYFDKYIENLLSKIIDL